MTIFCEKIRHLFNTLDEKEQLKKEEKRLKIEEEKKAIIKQEESTKKKLIASKKIFSNLKPDQLLEEVREKVWKAGKVIVQETEDGSIMAKLEYKRKEEFSETTQCGDSSYGTSWYKGERTDSLVIISMSEEDGRNGLAISLHSIFKDKREYVSKMDSENHSWSVNIKGEDYLKARQDLEQKIFSICETRITSGKWPFKK